MTPDPLNKINSERPVVPHLSGGTVAGIVIGLVFSFLGTIQPQTIMEALTANPLHKTVYAGVRRVYNDRGENGTTLQIVIDFSNLDVDRLSAHDLGEAIASLNLPSYIGPTVIEENLGYAQYKESIFKRDPVSVVILLGGNTFTEIPETVLSEIPKEILPLIHGINFARCKKLSFIHKDAFAVGDALFHRSIFSLSFYGTDLGRFKEGRSVPTEAKHLYDFLLRAVYQIYKDGKACGEDYPRTLAIDIRKTPLEAVDYDKGWGILSAPIKAVDEENCYMIWGLLCQTHYAFKKERRDYLPINSLDPTRSQKWLQEMAEHYGWSIRGINPYLNALRFQISGNDDKPEGCIHIPSSGHCITWYDKEQYLGRGSFAWCLAGICDPEAAHEELANLVKVGSRKKEIRRGDENALNGFGPWVLMSYNELREKNFFYTLAAPHTHLRTDCFIHRRFDFDKVTFVGDVGALDKILEEDSKGIDCESKSLPVDGMRHMSSLAKRNPIHLSGDRIIGHREADGTITLTTPMVTPRTSPAAGSSAA